MMKIPTIEFLMEAEKTFPVFYPETFKFFCQKYGLSNELRLRGDFICDIETLVSTNIKIGEGTWGDYEIAIAGKRHPKDGYKLWCDLLPIFIDGNDIYGFPYKEGSDAVHVWSVHTIVYSWSSFAEWLKDKRMYVCED